MDSSNFYEIRVEGHLSDRWSDWFDGLEILNDPGGEAILSGWISDQSALLGVLSKVQALNLVLISVRRSPDRE